MTFLSWLWLAVKTLANSKKAQIAFVSIVVWVGGRWGLKINEADLLPIVTACWAFIFGQGLADIGKERAKIEQPLATTEVAMDNKITNGPVPVETPAVNTEETKG
jgi:hypothetical protein